LAYDASVKFNSKTAETRVKSLSREIGQLRTRLKEASTASGNLGRAIKKNTADINHQSRRIRVLTNDLGKYSKAARKARTDTLGLGRALNSANMKRARGNIEGLNAPLARVTKSAKSATRAKKGLAGATNKASTASLGYSRRAQRAAAVTGRVERTVRNADKSFLGLAASMVRVRNLGLFLASGFGVQGIIEMADTYKLVAARLQIVTDSTAELTARQDSLLSISERTRSSYQANASLFVKLAQAGEQYGVTQQKALIVTENVAKAMKISGAAASEARAATQQLAQAFASGRIQGDELRSVLENSPRIAAALSSELGHLGINLSNIREKAKEGVIGIDELVLALGGANITADLAEEFAQIPLTIGDSITVAKNKILEAIGEFDSATGATDKIATAIVTLADNIDTLGNIVLVAGVFKLGKMVTTMTAANRSMQFLGRGLGGSKLGMQAFGTSVLRGATSLLRFAGPIGLVVTALELMDRKANFATDRIAALSNEMGDASNAAGTYYKQARAARIAQENLTKSQNAGVTGAGNLAGASRALTQDIYRMGLTAQWTAIQVAKAFRVEAETAQAAAQSEYDRSSASARRSGTSQSKSADAFRLSASFDRMELDRTNDILADARQAEYLAYREFQKQKYEFEQATTATVPGGGGSSSSGGGGGRSNSGSIAAERRAAREREQAIESASAAIAQMESRFYDAENARQEFNRGLGDLDKALALNVINQDRYNRLAGELSRDIFPGLTEQMSKLAIENENLQASIDGESGVVSAFRRETEPLREQIASIDYIIQTEGDRTGELQKQRDVLTGQIGDYADLVEENETLTTLNEERIAQEKAISSLIQESSDRLFESLTDSVRDALDLNKDSFKNFFNSIADLAKDTFANLIAATVFEPLQERFRKEMEAALSGSGRGRRGSGPLTADDIIRGGWTIPGAGATTQGEGEPIVVQAELPKGFFENFVDAYKGVWEDTFHDLKTLFGPFVDSIGKLFKDVGLEIGDLGQVLGKAFGGAQFGAQVAGIGKALGLNTSTTGGAIGGAIGSVLPIPGGQVIGSIAGSLLGGLFGGSKSGATTITGGTSDDLNTFGNSSSRREASIGLAGGVQDYLNEIADTFGGSVGGFNVTIGQRKGDFRVNTSGTSLKTSKGAVDFGDNESGAIAYAVRKAIEQGAIQGLRASTGKLLRAGDDLEAALQNALDFEGVFSRLKAQTDPIGAAFDDLGSEFEHLIDLFKQAGATSEEWTQLGQLFQEELSDVISSQLDTLISFRDDLIGGDASYKSATARLTIAEADFAALEDTIAAGGNVDQDEFTEAGQALQALAREVYGSTPEFQVYQQRLLDSTNRLIDSVQAEEANLQNIVDAIDAQTSSTGAALDVTNDYLARLLEQYGYSNGGSIQPSAPAIAASGYFNLNAF